MRSVGLLHSGWIVGNAYGIPELRVTVYILTDLKHYTPVHYLYLSSNTLLISPTHLPIYPHHHRPRTPKQPLPPAPSKHSSPPSQPNHTPETPRSPPPPPHQPTAPTSPDEIPRNSIPHGQVCPVPRSRYMSPPKLIRIRLRFRGGRGLRGVGIPIVRRGRVGWEFKGVWGSAKERLGTGECVLMGVLFGVWEWEQGEGCYIAFKGIETEDIPLRKILY